MFEDIKSTMGVALVNLVWRRMAVTPSVLYWSWQTLKPHYQSGVIPAASWLLREQLELPAAVQMSATELNCLKHELNDATVIDNVLRTYERGNAQNLIALLHLQLCLDSSNHSNENTGSSFVQPNRDQSSIDLLDANQILKQRVDAQFGKIPELPQLTTLPEDIQSLITRSSEIWVPVKYKGITPSVFRHLAYWPELLTLFVNRLEAVERVSAPSIQSAAALALTISGSHAAMLGEGNVGVPKLSNADHQWLQELLEAFINGILARGVIIVPTLRALLS